MGMTPACKTTFCLKDTHLFLFVWNQETNTDGYPKFKTNLEWVAYSKGCSQLFLLQDFFLFILRYCIYLFLYTRPHKKMIFLCLCTLPIMHIITFLNIHFYNKMALSLSLQCLWKGFLGWEIILLLLYNYLWYKFMCVCKCK